MLSVAATYTMLVDYVACMEVIHHVNSIGEMSSRSVVYICCSCAKKLTVKLTGAYYQIEIFHVAKLRMDQDPSIYFML